MGSLCITWLLYPPLILLYKPKYFPRLYNCVLAQFFVMPISFFFELTVEDPYTRQTVYLEGLIFMFSCMLYFLVQFLVVYFYSYGWLYRSYFVHVIALQMKRKDKNTKDENEITIAIGREVDAALREEIDDYAKNLRLEMYPENEEDKKNVPFQLRNITSDLIFEKVEMFLDKNVGDLSLALYKNYYTDSISSMLNRTIFLVIMILNTVSHRYWIILNFLTSFLAM